MKSGTVRVQGKGGQNMPEKPRKAIVKPWNMLLIVGMFILAVLAGRISDRIPALPPWITSRIVLMAGTITLAVFMKELLIWLRMSRWPRTEGVVISSEITRSDDGESIVYRPLVRCSYQVDGTGHVTETLHPGHENHSSSFEWRWRKLVDRYPTGRAVTVFYNPANPSEAYLAKANTMSAIASLILTLALLALFLVAPRLQDAGLLNP